jgi:Tfp pilus assembly protein PilV
MNTKQNGFGLIEGLLILVIIGLVGFVGWYIIHTKNTTYNSNPPTNNAKASSAQISSTAKTSEGQPCYTLNRKWEDHKDLVLQPEVSQVLATYKWANVEVRLHSLENLWDKTKGDYSAAELKTIEENKDKTLATLDKSNFSLLDKPHSATGFHGCITKNGASTLTQQADISKIIPSVVTAQQ